YFASVDRPIIHDGEQVVAPQWNQKLRYGGTFSIVARSHTPEKPAFLRSLVSEPVCAHAGADHWNASFGQDWQCRFHRLGTQTTDDDRDSLIKKPTCGRSAAVCFTSIIRRDQCDICLFRGGFCT